MGTKKITITHKREDCIGCGVCALIASKQWSMNEVDGRSDLSSAIDKGDFLVSQIEEDDLEFNKEAAFHCPTNAIRIEGQ